MLHKFDTPSDGLEPQGGLLAVNGKLYGTTAYGGSECGNQGGCGTVYSITTSGEEKIVYSFAGGTDGRLPMGTLVNVGRTLYGTTHFGGASGLGTVYSVSTSGVEQVVHSFAGGSDGEYPAAGLIDVDGTLYGSTTSGGGSDCTDSNLCGTIFTVTTNGMEAVVHSFARASAGTNPMMRLLDANGTLYGTTTNGGRQCRKSGHCGVVFSLTP